MFKRKGIRKPIGEYGVGVMFASPLVFSAINFASTSSRVALMVLTRISKVAPSCMLRAMVKASASPYCATNFSHNQSRTSACTANGRFSVDLALMVRAHSICCSLSMGSIFCMLMPCMRNIQAKTNLRASSLSVSSVAVTALKKRKRRNTP